MRRWVYAWMVGALVSAPFAMSAATEVVSVEGGAISGIVDRGVRVFKGIPYATPPVGQLRWKPPQPVIAWKGTRDASAFGAECPQTQYGAGSVYIRPLPPQSEDCLFLNVWTTAKPGDKQPVFVWIHGGALTKGSSISDVRDGVPLTRKGVVLVSLNYRLGALGYLAHPELTTESPHKSSGNYGVLDQIAALHWVQRNIAAFGGDPSRVTIGGESAGSWSVNTLVASPLAKGLFIRAIGQSGGRFGRTPDLHEDRGSQQSAENVGVAFAKSVGASSLAALRELPADIIAARAVRTQENVDGRVLPDEIRFTHVPPHPRARELKAFHASDIPYVFNMVPSSDPREAGFAYTDRDRALAHAMSDYWVNFIKNGDPNGNGLTTWPAYDVENEPYLELGATIRSGMHLLKQELDFLEKALGRR